MRSLTVLAALIALVATTASAQPAPPPGEALFVVSGGGWGHGVGMPQYGAMGQANEGKNYQQILAYYYTGTELGPASSRWMRVLLAENRRTVTISSPGPLTAERANGKVQKLPKGDVVVGGTIPGASARPLKDSPLYVFRPGKGGPLSFDGNAYRGRFEVHRKGTRLSVINVVPLDAYLQGVVASEMPFGWPTEALRAQAVAARTYALGRVVKGKAYHLVSDVRDQVYRGIAGEKPSTNEAVRATAGKVVLYGGKLATTYYFSSSGGRTANAADVFGFSVPYLVSKPDPWDKVSPHHRWGPVLIDDATLRAKLGAGGRVVDAVGTPTPSGRVRALTLQTVDGQKLVEGTDVRMALGLRSTYMTFGVLRLDKPAGTVVAETPVKLTGIARGLESPVLAASLDGSSWSKVGPVSRTAAGIVSIQVKPKRTIRYRLEVKGAASPAIVVQVKPQG